MYDLAIGELSLRFTFGSVINTVWRMIRLVGTYWPGMMAWFLVGSLGQYITVEVAGWVGATSAIFGLALMPFAILFRLVGFVAMLLVVRRGMPNLSSVTPVPDEAEARRGEFVSALLAGILPFFAFYFAQGLLDADMARYYARLYNVQLTRLSVDGGVVATGDVTLTWFTGAAVVVTFILRRIIKRVSTRFPRVVPVIAVYVEALWVFLSLLIVRSLLDGVTVWIDTRQGVAWWASLRATMARQAAPVDWLVEFGGWLLGQAGGLVVSPLAWLTIAGVIYGQSLEPPPASARALAERLVATGWLHRAAHRVRRVPGWFRSRIADLWADLTERVRPIGNALRLMWHIGPVLIASFVLLYQSYGWLEGTLRVVVSRLAGPHPLEFWYLYDSGIFLIAPALAAPFGVAAIAATFDSALSRVRRQPVWPPPDPPAPVPSRAFPPPRVEPVHSGFPPPKGLPPPISAL